MGRRKLRCWGDRCYPPTAAKDEVQDAHRQYSTAGLLLVGYFWTSGGIFGNEEIMAAAPSGLAFYSLLCGALFFAVPISLVTGELATAMPYDGGLVAWVHEACGPRIGAHNMYLLWLAYISDAASYPVFAAEYLGQRFNMARFTGKEEQGVAIVADMIVVGITLVKLGGTDYIVRVSGLFFVISMVPATVFIVYGSKDLEPARFVDVDIREEAGGVDAATLVTWVNWMFAGFLSLGSLAGEVSDPSKAYPTVVALLVPLVSIYVMMPVMVAISLDNNRSNYEAGHFDQLASDLAGDWLGWAFIWGACFSFIGLYNAQMIVCERSVAAFLAKPALALGARHKGNRLLGWLVTENGTGVAPVFIVFNAAITAALVHLEYKVLVGFGVLTGCIPTFLLMYAYLWYKVKQPLTHRPFKVPCGMVGAVLAVFSITALTAVCFYFVALDEAELIGVPYAKSVALGASIVVGVLVDLGNVVLQRTRTRLWPHRYKRETINGYIYTKVLIDDDRRDNGYGTMAKIVG